MKILISIHSSVLGGSVISAFELGIEMKRREHEVAVVVPEFGPAVQRYMDKIQIIQDPELIHRGVGSKYLSDYNLVYASNIFSHRVIDAVKQTNKHIPVVYALRGNVISTQHQQGVNTSHFRKADHLLFASEKTRREYIAYLNETPSSVIHLGIKLSGVRPPTDPEKTEAKISLGIDPNTKTVFSIGSFTKNKNHISFIESARHVAQNQGSKFTYILVGDDDYDSDLTYLKNLKERAIAKRVTIFPKRPNPTVFYRAADIVVIPSLSEGMPRVLLEAASHEVPCISTDVGGILETFSSKNILITSGSEINTGELTQRLLRNDESRKELGLNARKVVEENHSLESNIGNEHEALFEKLCNTTQ